MASIARDPNGRKRILFVAPDGRRKTIRLGKMPGRAAETIKTKVESLLAAAVSGCAWPGETARWVADLGDGLADKLAAVGLVPKRGRQAEATLGPFLDAYIRGRTDVKPMTTRNMDAARKKLVAFFGEGKLLADISPGDADDFRRHLLERLADNTVRLHCGRAKEFFRAALRKRLIGENPFADLPGTVRADPSRSYFVAPAEAARVLAACPDAEWRLIFALSRYGGLRCPSEHLRLTWGDVDWERGRLTVHSPKTERHTGGASRTIPLFPELRSHLEEVFDLAEPGTEYIVTRYRGSDANLRHQLLRIVARAGLEPWPKIFHNLRATRETELAERFPMHVVCKWIGNSRLVAAKHYLQVTEEHYSQAVVNATSDIGGAKSGAVSARFSSQDAASDNG